MVTIDSVINVYTVLLSAGICSGIAVSMSSLLISQHLQNFTQPSIQSKIVAITYMIPIYSVDSFLGLLFPEISMYINLLRDCYEAYVLYLFVSLMLGYLGCDEDEAELALYLDNHLQEQDEGEGVCCLLPLPPVPHAGQLGRGRRFLRQSKVSYQKYMHIYFIFMCFFYPISSGCCSTAWCAPWLPCWPSSWTFWGCMGTDSSPWPMATPTSPRR
ncbi:OSTA/TMEM184 family protein [archaeon]|nr:MAG: OSTA/TMEM184 family protein [archaeon]